MGHWIPSFTLFALLLTSSFLDMSMADSSKLLDLLHLTYISFPINFFYIFLPLLYFSSFFCAYIMNLINNLTNYDRSQDHIIYV